MSHQFSGFTVGGIRKALEKLGIVEQVLASVSPAAAEVIRSAGVFKFHPGVAVDEVMLAAGTLHGDEMISRVMEEATRMSIDGVVAPLARMYLTLKGNQPSVLLERFNEFLKPATRGLSSTWVANGLQAGTLSLTYPEAVDRKLAWAWRGAIRYVLLFCKREGTVNVIAPSADGLTFNLAVEWK